MAIIPVNRAPSNAKSIVSKLATSNTWVTYSSRRSSTETIPFARFTTQEKRDMHDPLKSNRMTIMLLLILIFSLSIA